MKQTLIFSHAHRSVRIIKIYTKFGPTLRHPPHTINLAYHPGNPKIAHDDGETPTRLIPREIKRGTLAPPSPPPPRENTRKGVERGERVS